MKFLHLFMLMLVAFVSVCPLQAQTYRDVINAQEQQRAQEKYSGFREFYDAFEPLRRSEEMHLQREQVRLQQEQLNYQRSQGQRDSGGGTAFIAVILLIALSVAAAWLVMRRKRTLSTSKASAAPPPLYYIIRPGSTQEGPYSEEQLIRQYNEGKLTDDVMVWKIGLEAWTPLWESPLATKIHRRTCPPPPPCSPPPPPAGV